MTQSGGHLRVESDVGVGTTIKLYFPAVFEPVPIETEYTRSKPASGRTGRVLLIEDNENVLRLMQAILKRHGHKVLTAQTTSSAIQVFENALKIDLLITDIAIPGRMQGPQLARYFKQTQPDLPVIFVSGYSFGLEAKEAGLTESDLLLTKPVRQKELIEAVNRMLAMSVCQPVS